jgi:hypothetical protein
MLHYSQCMQELCVCVEQCNQSMIALLRAYTRLLVDEAVCVWHLCACTGVSLPRYVLGTVLQNAHLK